jgi:hypothetical protein
MSRVGAGFLIPARLGLLQCGRQATRPRPANLGADLMTEDVRGFLGDGPSDGVVADWDALIPALAQSVQGIEAMSSPAAATFHRTWQLASPGGQFALEILVYRSVREARDQIRPTNFGAVASKETLGDLTAEVGLDPDSERALHPAQLIWIFRNVAVFLSTGPSRGHDARQRLRLLGETVQRFLADHWVQDLPAFLPLVQLQTPLPARMTLGSTLRVLVRTGQVDDADLAWSSNLEVRTSGGHGELQLTSQAVGPLPVEITLYNRKTLLGSAPISGSVQVACSTNLEPRRHRRPDRRKARRAWYLGQTCPAT